MCERNRFNKLFEDKIIGKHSFSHNRKKQHGNQDCK